LGNFIRVFHMESVENLEKMLYQVPKGDADQVGYTAEYKEQDEAENQDLYLDHDVSYDYGDRSSATQQDYLEVGHFINRDLKLFSIPYPYKGPIDFTFKEVDSRVRVVNTILDLLNQRQQSKEFIVEAQEVIRKLGVSKRDVKQRTQIVLKECNEQEKKIKKLEEKLHRRDREFEKKDKDLRENLEDILKEKQSLEFRAKQNITDNKKKDRIIQELRSRAKSLMNFQEARVTLGLRSINDNLIFSKGNPGVNRRNKLDVNELLKEELQYKKQQIEYLTNENHNIRHDLMTLRREVERAVPLLQGPNDDELYEDMSMSVGDLDIDALGGSVHYAKPHGRRNLSSRRSEAVQTVNEGRRLQHTSISPSAEEGEVAPKGPSPALASNMLSGHQPGSMQMSNTLPDVSEIDMDLSFEKYIYNEPNPMGDYEDGANLNVDEFAAELSDLPKGDLNEYENINIDL